jgi:hypothetical protein
MLRLVAIAGHIRDPAERAAIGHAHAERLSALRHARREQRGRVDDREDRLRERFLRGAIEIARLEL